MDLKSYLDEAFSNDQSRKAFFAKSRSRAGGAKPRGAGSVANPVVLPGGTKKSLPAVPKSSSDKTHSQRVAGQKSFVKSLTKPDNVIPKAKKSLPAVPKTSAMKSDKERVAGAKSYLKAIKARSDKTSAVKPAGGARKVDFQSANNRYVANFKTSGKTDFSSNYGTHNKLTPTAQMKTAAAAFAQKGSPERKATAQAIKTFRKTGEAPKAFKIGKGLTASADVHTPAPGYDFVPKRSISFGVTQKGKEVHGPADMMKLHADRQAAKDKHFGVRKLAKTDTGFKTSGGTSIQGLKHYDAKDLSQGGSRTRSTIAFALKQARRASGNHKNSLGGRTVQAKAGKGAFYKIGLTK